MHHVKAQTGAHIREIIAMPSGQQATLPAAWISCPAPVTPAPGRYLLATGEDETDPLAGVLFASGYSPDGFLAAPPIPDRWLPGDEIQVSGPFGHGFTLPHATRRLALAATCAPLRLLALLPGALAEGMDVALFCDNPPGGLPSSVEVMPLSGLAEGVRWADFLAVEVEQRAAGNLADWMGSLPMCPAQVLVRGAMPCGGLADCGICAVESRSGTLLACKDGPVFPLAQLWR